jgi:hypothetical protein
MVSLRCSIELAFCRDVHLIPKNTFHVLFLGGLRVMDSGQLFIDDDVSLVARFLPLALFVFDIIRRGARTMNSAVHLPGDSNLNNNLFCERL